MAPQARHLHCSRTPAAAPPPTLLSCSLVDNDATFYPLQALPELLEILLLLWPKLMPRAALGRGFARWWAATHHQGGSGSSGAITNASSAAESGTLKVAKGSEW